MNIRIITLVGLNQGNRLQNYALQYFLQKLGHEVSTVMDDRVQFLNRPFVIGDIFNIYVIKCIIKYIINYKNFRSFCKRELKRRNNYWKFNDQNIIFDGTKSKCKNLDEKTDIYVVGSDQIWNYNFINDNNILDTFWLLDFGKKRKISYAASFGVEFIPEVYCELYRKYLSSFSSLSIREARGCDIAANLYCGDIYLHVDPTMLLTKEEWCSIEEKPKWYDDTRRYIVTYFLGNRGLLLNEAINDIAKENELEIIHILDSSDLNWYCVNPSEFIYLIRNASMVYTDSFHATVFSIMFNIPFVVCDRDQKEFSGNRNMNSRIDTLLKYFGFENRKGNLENGFKVNGSIDFSNVSEILFKERNRSSEYFHKYLE